MTMGVSPKCSQIIYLQHTPLKGQDFFIFIFSPNIFLAGTEQQMMKKSVKTEEQPLLSPSIHLRNQLSSSQVCAHPFVVRAPLWREESHRDWIGFRTFIHKFLNNFQAFFSCDLRHPYRPSISSHTSV